MTRFVLDARTATPHFPGIGRYVANLARALMPLLAAGEQLMVLCDPAYPIALPPSNAGQMVTVAVSPFSVSQQWAVPRLLRRLRADLYHSSYIAMPYRPGIPAMLTVYDLIPLRYPAHSTARARFFVRVMTRLALRAARHVITISEFARCDFMAEFGLPPDRITAIPLAAGLAFRPQSSSAVAEFRFRCGLPERFVLYLGSNKPHKNLVRLVEAWHLAHGEWQAARGGCQMTDYRLVIAGAWDERFPEARQRSQALGADASILWLGPVPEADLPALYAAATAFVFPSLYEGFGLPVLEAMACGTPVICSNTSSLAEVAGLGNVLTRPAAALLSDPTDVQALSSAICRIIAEPALQAELSERGLARAAEFTWEQTAAATLALYRKTLA